MVPYSHDQRGACRADVRSPDFARIAHMGDSALRIPCYAGVSAKPRGDFHGSSDRYDSFYARGLQVSRVLCRDT
jgi:hypothetical protein